MNWKKPLALLLSAGLILSLGAPALAAAGPAAPVGRDLTLDADAPWYLPVEQFVDREGLFEGVEGGFRPEAAASRAVVFQTLWNLEGQPLVSRPTLFPDVSLDLWYAPSVSWGRETGLASGDDQGLFRGDEGVTRTELAVIFARYLRFKSFPEVENGYASLYRDLDQVPEWGKRDMLLCTAYGIISGNDLGYLNPNAAASQAELGSLLMKLRSLSAPEKLDAVVYLEGFFGATYAQRYDPAYLALAGQDAKAAREARRAHLDRQVEFLLAIYDVEYPSEEDRKALRELFDQLYERVELAVVSVSQEPDGSFTAQVSVTPLDIVQLTDAALPRTMAPFFEKYPSQVQQEMTLREYKAMDAEWAGLVVGLFQSKLSQVKALPAQTLELKVERKGEGYTVPDKELERLDEVIIPYFPEGTQE